MNLITKHDVLSWHGSDHTIEELAEILADVINGKYPLKILKGDIEEYIGDDKK